MKENKLLVRHAQNTDLQALIQVENRCFPPAEACSYAHMLDRLNTYPDHFFIHEEYGRIVSFVDGLVNKEHNLKDAMYEDTSMHQKDGNWLMILGVATDPVYRHHHFASICLSAAIQQAKADKLYGVVLTCKEALIPFYAALGFQDEGISTSVHGNVIWHQMRLTF